MAEIWDALDREVTLNRFDRLEAKVEALSGEIASLKEELEMRERQFQATQANMLKASEALRRASETEKKSRGRLPR